MFMMVCLVYMETGMHSNTHMITKCKDNAKEHCNGCSLRVKEVNR